MGTNCMAGILVDTPVGRKGGGGWTGPPRWWALARTHQAPKRLIGLPEAAGDVLCMAPNFAPAVSGYI